MYAIVFSNKKRLVLKDNLGHLPFYVGSWAPPQFIWDNAAHVLQDTVRLSALDSTPS